MSVIPYAAGLARSILIVYAHPYPDRSRAGRALLAGVSDMAGVAVRSLYDLYPDFSIDVDAERQALSAADVLVWQCPFYWYGMPSLMHLWIEKVLGNGWAYGPGGTAVRGKTALWVTTTGAPIEGYRPDAMHGHPFEAFVPAISQTAVFCGMKWQAPPLVVHGAHRISNDELEAAVGRYRRLLERLSLTDTPQEAAPDA
jgi:glutathione-regulated potassium-efflux system ancillary protein KefF